MESIQPPSTYGTNSRILPQVMMFSIIVTLFIMMVLFLFLHLYAKYWSRNYTEDRGTEAMGVKHRGLEPSTLKSLPIVVYDPKDFKEELECAVCLSEFIEGEKARILPKCDHGFHVDCIDMWFKSHSTCPLCRSLVGSIPPQNPNENDVGELQEEEQVGNSITSNDDNVNSRNIVFPTNVLFWGDETQVRSLGHDASLSTSTSREHELVIEIPRDDCQCPSSQEEKSPMMTQLRSLKRLLSRGKKVAMALSPRGSSSGGGGGIGVEQV